MKNLQKCTNSRFYFCSAELEMSPAYGCFYELSQCVAHNYVNVVYE